MYLLKVKTSNYSKICIETLKTFTCIYENEITLYQGNKHLVWHQIIHHAPDTIYICFPQI